MNGARTISLAVLLATSIGAFVYFGFIRQQPVGGTVLAQAPMSEMAKSNSSPGVTPNTATQNTAIFVPPEKQQLIGMRSVAAEMGTLTKEIRIVGKVTYDETQLTHIHRSEERRVGKDGKY